jgi:hypothetical protein
MERLPTKLPQAAKTPLHCTFLSRRGFHTNGLIVSDSDVLSVGKKALCLLMYFLEIPLICTGRYRRGFETDFRLVIVVRHECRHVYKGQ